MSSSEAIVGLSTSVFEVDIRSYPLSNLTVTTTYDIGLLCSVLVNLSALAMTMTTAQPAPFAFQTVNSALAGKSTKSPREIHLDADWPFPVGQRRQAVASMTTTLKPRTTASTRQPRRRRRTTMKSVFDLDEDGPGPTTETYLDDDDLITEPPTAVEQLLEENYVSFRRLADVITLMAFVLGLIFNCGAAVIVVRDDRKLKAWRVVHCGCIFVDQMILIASLALMLLVNFRVFETSPLSISGPLPMTWWLERLAAINSLTALIGAFQIFQPWLLYVISAHDHECLIVERQPPAQSTPSGHRRRRRQQELPLSMLPSFPVFKLVPVAVVAVLYFIVSLPPVRVQLFLHVPHHTSVCSVPLIDIWDLVVATSAARDPFYLACYNLVYVVVVHLAPVLPLLYRSKRIVDEIHRRPDDIPTASDRATLCRWSETVAALCSLQLVAGSIKTSLLAMRLVDCAVSLSDGLTTSPMQAGYLVFRYLNVVGNVGQLTVRPCCHLPVMVKYDWKLRADFDRIVRGLKRKGRTITNRIKSDVRRLFRIITDEEFDMAAYGSDNSSDNGSELCAQQNLGITKALFEFDKSCPATIIINKNTVC